MLKRSLMFLLAVVAGYVVMFLLILVSQEGLFGRITYGETPLPQLLMSGVLTMCSAVVGGAVAAKCFGKPFYPPALAICGLVALETTYMISTAQLDGPVWFDVLAASSLLLGLVLGAFAVGSMRSMGRASSVVA